jgi:hypothetical protein
VIYFGGNTEEIVDASRRALAARVADCERELPRLRRERGAP